MKKKINAKPPSLYSTLKPETNSDSKFVNTFRTYTNTTSALLLFCSAKRCNRAVLTASSSSIIIIITITTVIR
jgi:hypothetical protein